MVQLTEEQVNVLKRLAKQQRTSVARLVRESVAQYVAAIDQQAAREERRLRALDLVEKIKRGELVFRDREEKTDISVQHDNYFAHALEDDLR